MSKENAFSRDHPNYDAVTPNNNEPYSYLSPEGARTPPPITSSQSLIGEDIVSSSRRCSAEQMNVELSPFTPSSATMTPPQSLHLPASLSPPPLNTYTSNADISQPEIQQSAQSVTSSYKQAGHGNTRPPRVPQVSLAPSRNAEHHRHGRVLSNTDYSFLSALTESSSDKTVPKRRTVSWDMNDPTGKWDTEDRRGAGSPGALTSATHKSTPASILQPILLDGTSRVVAPVASIFAANVKKNGEEEQPKTASRCMQRSTKASESSRTLPTNNITDWGVQDTGSFVKTSDFANDASFYTPPKKQSLPPKRYSVGDVHDATPREGLDEVDVLDMLEAQGVTSSAKSKQNILPLITDDRVHDFEEYVEQVVDEDRKSDRSHALPKGHRRSSPGDSLSDLIKKLLEASPEGKTSVVSNTTQYTAGVAEAAAKLFSSQSRSFRQDDNDVELGEESTGVHPVNEEEQKSVQQSRRHFRILRKLKDDADYFLDFMEPQTASTRKQFYRSLKFLMFPCLGVAFLLYYILGNPPKIEDSASASASWWLIFLGVRQVITLHLARLSQVVVIDFLIFRTRVFPRLLGTTLSLTVAQAKGWPSELFFWALIDFMMLWGDRTFVKHWAFWQDLIGMMNDSNPSGSVIHSNIYFRILMSALGLSVAVTLKRSIMGHVVGKRVVVNYRADLATLMKKLILLTELAYLSTRLRIDSAKSLVNRLGSIDDVYRQDAGLANEQADIDTNDSFEYSEAPGSVDSKEALVGKNSKEFSSSGSMSLEISEMLEQWEEPELQEIDKEDVDMSSVLQFRRAINLISDEFPFSSAFGSARTRERCIQSSQNVFERLTKGSPNEILDFDTLCLTARKADGGVDKTKVKELIRLFRPDRSGHLNKLEFVKSVDSVYKSLRLLLASIHSSSQIDRAHESLVNALFYIVSFFVLLGVMGVDTTSLFVGLAGVLVSFAFMIGSASAKYVEGLLFILVRRPYDIGDRVEISNATDTMDTNGPNCGWIVEKVDLYTTTVRLGTTREVATYSNGSLAGSRIVNLKRSEKPNIYVYFKFGVDVSSLQIELFRKRITEYVKERPREWIRLVSFRCKRIEADLGFMEYVIIGQHREAWQNLPAILQSKSDVLCFGLETQKELNMKYTAPHVPIDIHQTRDSLLGASSRFESSSRTDIFEDKKEK